jgi:nitroreductase
MSAIKESIKGNVVIIGIRLLFELMYEYWQLVINLGVVNTWGTKQKIQSYIDIESHAIEKGLSFKYPRVGFGEQRVIRLLENLQRYTDKFHDTEFLKNPVNVIIDYIKYQEKHGIRNATIIKKVDDLLNKYKIPLLAGEGGAKLIKRSEIIPKIDFKTFAEQRHATRNFSEIPVSNDVIIAAIEIAKKSPSVCNRQSWHVHLFNSHEIKNRLLIFQKGNKGFTEYIDKVVLITSNLNSFFIQEIHQGYIDGGLFAMSFIYALHSFGIATVPLTTSFPFYYRHKLYKEFSIPKNEIPIMMIGIGNYPEEFMVAVSKRKDTDLFYTIH